MMFFHRKSEKVELITSSVNGATRNLDAHTTNGMNGTVNGTAAETSKSFNQDSSDEENDDSFVLVREEDAVVNCKFPSLIEKMRQFHYNINVDVENLINLKCKMLFKRDYRIQIVEINFTDNYPKEIIIPVAEKESQKTNPTGFNVKKYTNLVKESSSARLRSRVVVPTILLDNKFICRSGTLTVLLSASYEGVKSSIPTYEQIAEAAKNPISALSNVASKGVEFAREAFKLLTGVDVMESRFLHDLNVLRYLKVQRIWDLMVEYNKHFKEAVYVSSTEKVHEGIYTNIKLEEMPFPGCEFFIYYNKANRQPEGLVFNWSQSDVTRTLTLTEDPKTFFPNLDIEKNEEWDLVSLTQNYLKIMLSHLLTETGSTLVHCISGWDRTPLFVSLMRLSLWADGVIHRSLDWEEMAYLTVAYDWFLFGHNLPDRLAKGEEVLHFCFNFLQYITGDEFSITRLFSELPPQEKENRTFPEFVPGRRCEVLNNIRNYVLDCYNSVIISRPITNESDYSSMNIFSSILNF